MECCNTKDNMVRRLWKRGRQKNENVQNSRGSDYKVSLIGNPNVGKSVIFNSLTGAYVTVSNYPGTTVEVSRGWYTSNSQRIEIIDTPGMYSITSLTEEERVTRNLLLNERPDLILHVIDAKNIQRSLLLTLQLLDAGFDVVLILNIMDEAKTLGIEINYRKLQDMLGISIISASAALNEGLTEIKEIIKEKVKYESGNTNVQ